MKYPTYPAYKDSSIACFQSVPQHWDVVRIDRLFAQRHEEPLQEDKLVSAFITGEVTLRENKTENTIKNSGQEIGYKRILKGDLVISGMNAHLGGLRISDSEGKGSPVNLVLKPIVPIEGTYFSYQLRHMAQSQFIRSLVNTIRFNSSDFKSDDLKSLFVLCPPLEEQQAISSFLCREIAKIDTLIAKQEQLIELLKEKRQSLISHAVTKGLNPALPYKDSGVAWLGDIPTHWNVKRLRYLCSITTGNRNTEDSIEGGKYPFFVRSQEVERINSYTFDGEAILTAGDGAGVGKVFHYYNGKLDFHQRVYLLSNFKSVLGKLLFYFIKVNFYKVVLEGNAKSTVDSLRLPMFQDFSIAYAPSIDEQKEIVEYIERESSKVDALIDKARLAIELLQEHRIALVSAAVTGKIDVRQTSHGDISNH